MYHGENEKEKGNVNLIEYYCTTIDSTCTVYVLLIKVNENKIQLRRLLSPLFSGILSVYCFHTSNES